MSKGKGHPYHTRRNLISLSSSLKTKIFLVFLFTSFAYLNPCQASFCQTHERHLIQDVPFFHQEEHQCGPASLAGIMNYWQISVTPSEIAKSTYSSSAKGTLGIDLAHYARDKGLSAEVMNGNWEELIKLVDAGYPLLVFVDLGFWLIQTNHYMVVVGYDKEGVIVNSGKEKEKKMKKRKFLKAWRKNGFWMMLIRNR